VLLLSSAYAMVTNTLKWLEKTHDVEIVEVPIKYPVKGAEDIIEAVESAYSKYEHGEIKMAIFSHISSMPTMIEPVVELTKIGHQHGSIVVIDGAHAPGHIPINVQEIGADFYTGNLHKWMYTPKGTAFLWVHKHMHTPTFPEPTMISSSGLNDYVGKFSYTGTRDYTALATIPEGFKFRELLGGDNAIFDYCHDLVLKAAHYLAEAWRTYLLVNDSMVGCMVNVVLPTDDAKVVNYVTTTLDKRYDIFMVTMELNASNPFTFTRDETAEPNRERVFYTRLSAQVYNEFSDYEQLGSLVPMLIQEYLNSSSPS
jgi:selenocysteine lyase/cysteine desulfurase